MRGWRFSRTPEDEAFLSAVLATAPPKIEIIKRGSLLYRAQVGCDWPFEAEEKKGDYSPRGYGPERMTPPIDRAPEGRANPRGIRYLYAATRPETAVAEMRAWMGALVSVAVIRIRRRLRVVNCTVDDRKTRLYFSGEPDAAERERACWVDVDSAFARPVASSDEVAEYAPTQMIAEMFRREGLDGIAYRSSFGRGHNIALFNVADAKVISCAAWSVDKITYESSQAGNPYFVKPSKRNRGKRRS